MREEIHIEIDKETYDVFCDLAEHMGLPVDQCISDALLGYFIVWDMLPNPAADNFHADNN